MENQSTLESTIAKRTGHATTYLRRGELLLIGIALTITAEFNYYIGADARGTACLTASLVLLGICCALKANKNKP
jgi:hypothetical protein